jgi:hypothetical protein
MRLVSESCTAEVNQSVISAAVCKRREQHQHLSVMLRGFHQYFVLHHCGRKLSWISGTG